MNNNRNLPYAFISFSALVIIAIFIFEHINHRFWLNDFKVYYGGAQSMIHHLQVYGVAYGLDSGLYKYSPFIALTVAPLTLVSFETAAIIQFFLIGVSIIAFFILSWKIIDTYLFDHKIKNKNQLLSIAFVCVISHLFRELHLGNVNAELLLLLCLSLWLMLHSRFIPAGILLAVVVMTKPFFILVLMPIVLRKNFKAVFSFSISMLAFLLLPALLVGFSKNMTLHKEWLHTMLEHNSSFPSSNTIESLIKFYIGASLSPSFQFYVMIAVCMGYVIFFFPNGSERRTRDNPSGLVLEWFLLIAVTPGLFKTDTQHFLLSLPLILILLCYLSIHKNYLLTACFILLIFFYGGNIPDLIGMKFSAWLDQAGVLGASNLILIAWTIFIYFKSIKQGLQIA